MYDIKISYLAYIIGAKFEEYHSNISQAILYFVISLCTGTICDIISFLTKLEYSFNERRYLKKKKTPFLLSLKGLSRFICTLSHFKLRVIFHWLPLTSSSCERGSNVLFVSSAGFKPKTI